MRLEQLKYLLAIEQFSSMNRASRNIFVSQQSISSAILELEEEFHTKLVIRTNKGSFLTEAGKELATAANIFFKECNRLKETYAETSKKEETILVEYAMAGLYDNLVLFFLNHYPNIMLNRVFTDIHTIYDDLQSNKNGIAILNLDNNHLNKFKLQNDITVKIISQSKLALLVSKQSTLSSKSVISLYDLYNLRILLYMSKEQPSILFNILKEYDFEKRNNTFIYSTSLSLQNKLSEYPDVCTFAPDTAQLDNYITIPIKEDIILNLCCISKRNHIPDELITALTYL